MLFAIFAKELDIATLQIYNFRHAYTEDARQEYSTMRILQYKIGISPSAIHYVTTERDRSRIGLVGGVAIFVLMILK